MELRNITCKECPFSQIENDEGLKCDVTKEYVSPGDGCTAPLEELLEYKAYLDALVLIRVCGKD